MLENQIYLQFIILLLCSPIFTIRLTWNYKVYNLVYHKSFTPYISFWQPWYKKQEALSVRAYCFVIFWWFPNKQDSVYIRKQKAYANLISILSIISFIIGGIFASYLDKN